MADPDPHRFASSELVFLGGAGSFTIKCRLSQSVASCKLNLDPDPNQIVSGRPHWFEVTLSVAFLSDMLCVTELRIPVSNRAEILI